MTDSSSSTTTKPTLVFIPGAWHSTSCYDPLLVEVEALGYPHIALTLPSVGTLPAAHIDDDVAHIRKTLTQLQTQGRDSVMIMHSYGGRPGSEAVHGFTKQEQEQEQEGTKNRGGVLGLVYLTAFTAPPGYTMFNFLNIPIEPAPWIVINEENGTSFPKDTHEVLYNGMSKEQADKCAATLKIHSVQCLMADFPKDQPRASIAFPSAYLVCTLDKAIPADLQRTMIHYNSTAPEPTPTTTTTTSSETNSPSNSTPDDKVDTPLAKLAKTVSMGGMGGGGFDVVEELECDHSPFQTRPLDTAQFLHRVVSRFIEWKGIKPTHSSTTTTTSSSS